MPGPESAALQRARLLVEQNQDEAASRAYVDILRLHPTHLDALNELGALARDGGHLSAACTAYRQAVLHHPADRLSRVALGTVLADIDDLSGAREQFEAALAIDPESPAVHQGLARVLTEMGDPAADLHRQRGFAGHAIAVQRYCGTGDGIRLLLLVSARGGNVPLRHWIDNRVYAVTAVYADFHDPTQPLPPHDLVVNAIGDADLCGLALDNADRMLSGGTAPVINPPARVRSTGRTANARRIAGNPDVIVPRIRTMRRAGLAAAEGLEFPLLLRSPGYHTGRHFVRVDASDALPGALASLPGDPVLAIDYLDARGPDGLARKYRVMFIDGVAYPLHLAISADWKVHYFTAAMAGNAEYRAEEQRFLEDMPGVLGEHGMGALARVQATLNLDYGGADFGLAPDGRLILFEANATMVVYSPDKDPIWDYRRRATSDVLAAARRMLATRSTQIVPGPAG